MQNKDFTLEDLQHTQYYMLCRLNDICEKNRSKLDFGLRNTVGSNKTQRIYPMG